MKVLLIDIPTHQVERLYADSAVGRDSMPLFVPGRHREWRGQVYLALRVSRLGKTVPARYGARYIDAYSAVLALEPKVIAKDKIEYLPDGTIHSTLSTIHCQVELGILDSAITTGTWVSLDAAADIAVNDLIPLETPNAEGRALTDISIDNLTEMAAQAVEIASRISTIKTGDILLLVHRNAQVDIKPDTYVRCESNGIQLLQVKIK